MPRYDACFEARTAFGEHSRIIVAQRLAASKAWPSGTTSVIKPSSKPSRAGTRRPVKIMPMAFLIGIERGRRCTPPAGTLGGSNRMLSARDVAEILAVPERTVRDKWREWRLPAYRIGKHLRWRERDVHAWIDRQTA